MDCNFQNISKLFKETLDYSLFISENIQMLDNYINIIIAKNTKFIQ